MSQLPNAQENNEEILNNIQTLQQMERQLFNSLESNPNLPVDQQRAIIEKMNELSNMRINLYRTLSGINNYFQHALNTSVGSLREQVVAIEIVETELNKAKRRLEILEEDRNNKIRLVEINNYFGDKYEEHAALMKIVIFTLVPVIIVTFMGSKGLLPGSIATGITVIVSLIGAYFFWRRYSSMIMRDSINYQQYDWPFNPATAPSGTSTDTDPWATNANSFTCVGDACCADGLVYDASSNICVVSTGSTTTASTASTTTTTTSTSATESFDNMIDNVLTKQQQGKYKTDVDLRNPYAYNL